ncbi:MAG: hypothetical protein JWM11_1762 [Planctomycetaceae bacterium]|nr:hypothetical protein [Planctomycetaceae bacterium]
MLEVEDEELISPFLHPALKHTRIPGELDIFCKLFATMKQYTSDQEKYAKFVDPKAFPSAKIQASISRLSIDSR